MLNKLMSYWKDEEAGLDDGIVKVLFIVGGIAVAIGIGYYAWNVISEQSKNANNMLDNASDPGSKDAAFGNNPFGGGH